MKNRASLFLLGSLLALAAAKTAARAEVSLIISIPEQRLAVIQDGVRVAEYPVSTSKYGVGDRPRSYATPLGLLAVAKKIGAGAPEGAVFRGEHMTGEILPPNAPGRDPIVTRILHLRGLNACNARAYNRDIYIHGTLEESKIGRPASYGCIRMRSRDVVRLFDETPLGAKIEIVNTPIARALADTALTPSSFHERVLAAN
jgi:lipoprotein-anchoring transpeptidase ErfK/SrfK